MPQRARRRPSGGGDMRRCRVSDENGRMRWIVISLLAVYFAGWAVAVLAVAIAEWAAASGDWWLIVGNYTSGDAWLWPWHLYRSLSGR